MKKMIIACFVLILSVGCTREASRNNLERYMLAGNVEYVHTFPQNIQLRNPKKVLAEQVGITGFRIIDSLMVLTMKGETGVIGIAPTNNLSACNRFFNLGNSEEEFIMTPTLSTSVSSYTISDTLFLDIFDSQKGRLLTMNVNKSLLNRKVVLKSIKKGLSNNVFNIVRLSEGEYLVKEINNNETQLIRSLKNMNTQQVKTNKLLDKLNSASVKPGEDFNILSTIMHVSNDGKIIEMPIGLNYLNIYKLDGSFAKTVCVGNELADIDQVMNQDRFDRLYTFADLKIYDNFFGVVFLNEKEKDYQSNSQKHSEILLFSLEGKPLARLMLPHHITSFDIDKNGNLYTFDVLSGEFLMYNIKGTVKF